MLDIKNIEGKVVFSTPINKGCKRKYTLMQEDYISLVFSVEEPIYFRLGDSIYDGQFEITDLVSPKYNDSTAGYDYEVRFDKYYWKWKNKKFFYTEKAREASWSLTANLYTQLSIVIKNLEFLNYRYKGKAFEFSVDSTVEKISKPLRYDNLNIIEALNLMAQTWECEWWVTDNIIHFGRCEYGTAVDFKLNDNVEKMSKSEGKQTFATRVYAFGSERNITKNYRPTDSMTVNGVVQKRLMLPVGTPFIDAYEEMTNEEAVEQVVIFDEVYPKLISKASKVESKEGKDEVGKIWTYFISDDSLKFDKKYILPDTELRLVFQSGKLNGLDFALSFADNKFEIIRNEDYGRLLPDDILKPEIGDEFILHGYDTTFVSDALLPKAEQELKEKAIQFVEKSKIDPATYECSMMSDYMLNGGNVRTFEVGDRVRLINKAYFKDSRVSRIIGYEYPLDMPYDSPTYIVGETASYSHLEEIKADVKELTYKEKTFSGSGSNVYVIGQHDSTPPTDRNVLSSQKSLNSFHRKDIPDSTDYLQKFNKGAEFGDYKNKKGAYINEEGKADFNEVQSNKVDTKDLVATNTKTTNLEADVSTLEKSTINDLVAQLAKVHSLTVEDTANILRAVVGSISSDTFKSGFAGEGFRIYEAINGDWNLEIDNVIVRKVFSVFELIIQKITHQGGMVIHSPNGAKITKVTDGGSYWKCEHDSATDFFKDDQILCQNFSGDNVKRYWRLTTSAGKGYLNLSKTDQEANSAIPSIGDEIVVLGNRTNINRQSAIMVVSVGDNSPYTAYYSNINSYSLVGKESTRIGNLNGVVDKDFGALKGNGLYSENVYLKGIFRLTNGKNVETVITENKLESDNRIEETKLKLGSEIDRANALAKSAEEKIDGLEIGGDNYLLNSNRPYVGGGSDGVITSRMPDGSVKIEGVKSGSLFHSMYSQSYFIEDDLLDGEMITISLWLKSDTKIANLPLVYLRTEMTYVATRGNIDNSGFRQVYATRTYRKSKGARYFNMHLQFREEGTYYFKYAKIEKGNKATDWTPAPEDQQSYTDKKITDVRTDFDVIEGKINMNVAETQRLVSVSNNHVAEATQASNKAQQNADKAKTEADLANKKALEAQANADKTEADVNASNQAKLDAQAKVNEAKAQADKANQEATKAKNDADKAKEAKEASEGILQSVTTKEANINVVAGEVNIKAKEATESATRAVSAEASINTKAGSIVLEASEKSAQKAIDGLEIGGRNLIIRHNERKGWMINLDGVEGPCQTSALMEGRIPVTAGEKLVFQIIKEQEKGDNYWRYAYYNDDDVVVKRYANSSRLFFQDVPVGATYMKVSYPEDGVIKLEKGNKATDWTQAPEDYEAQFQATNSKLELLSDQFTVEVAKTNGIRTDLTQVQQSHNEFKVQVKTDVANAIDSNNEVVKASFGMKDNILTAYGKEFNVLANLKVGNETILTKDGKIRTKLLDVEEIEDNTIFGGFVFMNGLLISQEGTDADGNFSTNWTEYKTGNFKPNLILDPKEGSNTALKGQFGLLHIQNSELIGKSENGKIVLQITGKEVPNANLFNGKWVFIDTKSKSEIEDFLFVNDSLGTEDVYRNTFEFSVIANKIGMYRVDEVLFQWRYKTTPKNELALNELSLTYSVFRDQKKISSGDMKNESDLDFYADRTGVYKIKISVYARFNAVRPGIDYVSEGLVCETGYRALSYKSTPQNLTYIGNDGLYTSFSSEEFLHYKAEEGFTLRAGNFGLRISKQGIQKWNGNQWVTANL